MSRRAWGAFLVVATLWGIPYLFIKVVVDDGVSPWFLAWARVTLGAALLLVLARRAGVLGQLRGAARPIVAYAVLEIALPFPLIGLGEQHVASSLAAILIASVPAIGALLALRLDRSQRVTGARAAGLGIGFGGVVALVGLDVSGSPEELLGAAAVLAAAAGYAAGPMLLNAKLPGVDPRATMAASLAVAATVLTPLAALHVPETVPPAEALASIAVLAVLCTAAAFVVFGTLVAEVGPARASVITYVAPLVAVALGVVALGEPVGLGAVLGLVLILAGSWVATGGRLPGGPARPRALVRGRAR